MAHPPQHNYQQYAMRPGPPQGYASGSGAYPPQGGPGQDPGRFYNGPPGGGTFVYSDHSLRFCADADTEPYQTSSPPPNFQQGQNPAPFYVGGSEVPANRPGSTQQYPPRNETPHQPSAGNAPGPIDTSPPTQNYAPYSQPPQGHGAPYSQAPAPGVPRPQSTYGAQELATSVYDSPIAPNNPHSANTYTSSVYSQEDYENRNQTSSPQGPYSSQPPPQQYQSYNPPPENAPPPVPTGQAPDVPAPLQPGGPPFDARHGLPSQGAPPQPSAPQYKPYVPPGQAPQDDGPSAPAPSDYYRQSGVY